MLLMILALIYQDVRKKYNRVYKHSVTANNEKDKETKIQFYTNILNTCIYGKCTLSNGE